MGISWIDKRQLINFVFLGQFFFWGCSSVKVPVYTEPILLDQNPVVFVRYAYDEIQLNISVKFVDGNLTAYKLSIYKFIFCQIFQNPQIVSEFSEINLK